MSFYMHPLFRLSAANPDPDGTFRFSDEDQAFRVLSSPQNRLILASPYPTENLDSPQDNFNRIAIEITPSGALWRTIPKPLFEGRASFDGSWPRLVDICKLVLALLFITKLTFFSLVGTCEEAQWDVFCLDPAYVCTIRPTPHMPTVRASCMNTRQVGQLHVKPKLARTFPRSDSRSHKSQPAYHDLQHSRIFAREALERDRAASREKIRERFRSSSHHSETSDLADVEMNDASVDSSSVVSDKYCY